MISHDSQRGEKKDGEEEEEEKWEEVEGKDKRKGHRKN